MTPPRSPEPTSGSSRQTMANRLRALADVVDRSPEDLPDASVEQTALEALAALDAAEAAATSWLGAVDDRLIWVNAGARSKATWLAGRSELSRPHAAALFARARDLRSCPHVGTAYRTGRVGTAKVRLLLAARTTHESLFAEHEAGLVDAIAPLTVAQAQLAIARWQALAQATKEADERASHGGDPDSSDEPEPDAAGDNSFHLATTFEGRLAGTLDLDAVQGAELSDAVRAHIDACFQNGSYRADDGMTVSQRNAAALVELVRRGANPAATKHGVPRPSVSVTIDHRSLTNQPADDLQDGLARRMETAAGVPVSRATAERLCCTGRISAIHRALHEDGTIEVLGVTDLHRHPNARQRTALRTRDGGCLFPGCDAPVDWCDAHHLTPAEVGGPTLLANLVLLCRHHHHLVHEGGWRMWRASDDKLYLQDRDGVPVALVPPGTKTSDAPPPASPPEPPPPYPVRVRFRS